MKLRPATVNRPARSHRQSAKPTARTHKGRKSPSPTAGPNSEFKATCSQAGSELLRCVFIGTEAIVAEALEIAERMAPAGALAGRSGETSLMQTRFAVEFERPEPMPDDYIAVAIVVAR